MYDVICHIRDYETEADKLHILHIVTHVFKRHLVLTLYTNIFSEYTRFITDILVTLNFTVLRLNESCKR